MFSNMEATEKKELNHLLTVRKKGKKETLQRKGKMKGKVKERVMLKDLKRKFNGLNKVREEVKEGTIKKKIVFKINS